MDPQGGDSGVIQKTCPGCGQSAPPTGRFCAGCGRPLGASDADGRPAARETAAPRLAARWIDAYWCVGVALAVFVHVAFLHGVGSDNGVATSYDIREIFAYHKAYYRDALLQGRLPLWNPHTFSGWPFAANALTQVFYPPALLALLLPLPQALVLDLALHLVAAALGTYWLLRSVFRLAPGPAAVGGLAFACCGALVGHAYVGHIQFYDACAYMPFILLALERSVARLEAVAPGSGRGVREWLLRAGAWPWVAGLLLGLQLLTGGIQFAWYTLLLAFLWRAGCVLARRPLRFAAWRDSAAMFLILCVVGGGVAAVQLAPGYELAKLSNRATAGYGYAREGSFPPAMVWTLVNPGTDMGRIEGIWEYYAYCGYLPLLLAAIGMLTFSDRRVVVLLACAALAFVYMLGDYARVGPVNLFELLWEHVPGFNLFRNPGRAVIVVQFVVALLAGIGLGVAERLIPAGAPRRRHAASAVCAAVAALVLIDTTAVARYYRVDPGTWADVPPERSSQVRPRLMIPDARVTANPMHKQTAEALAAAAAQSWHRIWLHRRFLKQNHAFAMKARSIGGYDNLYLQRYSRFVHFMTDTPVNPALVTVITNECFANVPSPFPFKVLGERFVSVNQSGQWRAQQRPAEAVRRGWFTTAWRSVADEPAALAWMRGDAFVPYGEAVFEAPEAVRLGLPLGAAGPDPPTSQPVVDVDVLDVSPEHLRIRVGPHPAGFLVLSEIHYPGWRARVAGRELPVLRADSILRCVSLPAAEAGTTLDMTFEPGTLVWGGAVSGVTAALAMLAAVATAAAGRNRRP